MTLATIDWLRAGADIVGAFACALIGQWWGYSRGYDEGRATAEHCGFVSPTGSEPGCQLVAGHRGDHMSAEPTIGNGTWIRAWPNTPDRQDERIAPDA